MSLRGPGPWAALVAVVALVAAACGGGGGDDPPETTTTTTTTTTVPVEVGDEPVLAPLTGETVDPDSPLQPRALVVKIGNNDERARPQAGLVEADLVYEELIEGLKTRFAAVFHTEAPDRIGPVRSGRSSDLELVADLGGPYVAYSGGNPTVLSQFREGVDAGLFIDISILAEEAPYSRDPDRDAPDNLYFDFSQSTLVDGESYPAVLFERSPEPAWPSTRTGTGIVVRYPSSFGRESVHLWDEDLAGWVRVQDGTIHTAEVDGAEVEIAPTNIVVMEIAYVDSAADPESPQALTFGTGRAWVLVDGNVIEGTWERAADEPGYLLADSNGDPIGLLPGSTWILLANDGTGSARFGTAEIEVIDSADGKVMLDEAREIASVNSDS